MIARYASDAVSPGGTRLQVWTLCAPWELVTRARIGTGCRVTPPSSTRTAVGLRSAGRMLNTMVTGPFTEADTEWMVGSSSLYIGLAFGVTWKNKIPAQDVTA
jgi:hypothetical protein